MKHKMKFEDILSKAKQICAIKETCAFDLEKKLEVWEVCPEDKDKIIRYLYENRFIDDKRYASAFANDRLKFNRWGKYKIRVYLRQKKIPEDVINTTLNNIDNNLYIDILHSEIDKKLPGIKGKTSYEIKAKLLRFIAGRGFETDIASELINNKIKSEDL